MLLISMNENISKGNLDQYNGNNIVLTISAKIHPTDHISIALVYPFALSIISGARYHLVATYSVNSPT